MSMFQALMRLGCIKKAVTVYGFKGSRFNENLKSLTSKVNERKLIRLG